MSAGDVLAAATVRGGRARFCCCGCRRRCARRRRATGVADLDERYQSLTQRERDIMGLVVIGRLNKQIAAELGLAEVTVKAHRGQIMHKMGAKSLPELVRMADRLRGTPDTD